MAAMPYSLTLIGWRRCSGICRKCSGECRVEWREGRAQNGMTAGRGGGEGDGGGGGGLLDLATLACVSEGSENGP